MWTQHLKRLAVLLIPVKRLHLLSPDTVTSAMTSIPLLIVALKIPSMSLNALIVTFNMSDVVALNSRSAYDNTCPTSPMSILLMYQPHQGISFINMIGTQDFFRFKGIEKVTLNYRGGDICRKRLISEAYWMFHLQSRH